MEENVISASFYEEDPSKALTASFSSVSRFLMATFYEMLICFLQPFRTMQDIDTIARGGTGTGDDINDMM